jgi:hypothetical protein
MPQLECHSSVNGMIPRATLLSASAFVALCLASCGGIPANLTTQEIEKAVRSVRGDMFDAEREAAAAEVTAIKVAGWETEALGAAGNGVEAMSSQWTATLRFLEPIGFVLVQVDGTKVVRVVAAKGDEIAFSGRAHALKVNSAWQVSAMADTDGDGPYKGLWAKAGADNGGKITMGYQVIENGLSVSGAGRGSYFQPLSRLQPCVVEGSKEDQALASKIQERQQKDAEAAAARAKEKQDAAQAALREQQEAKAKADAERAEQQRLAAEAQQQQVEEQQRKAAAARHEQLLPLLAPLQSPHGAVITTDAPAAMATVLLQIEVDAPNLTAKGKAIELRTMPFREVAFEAKVDTRTGVLTFQPAGGEAIAFGIARGAVASRAGHTLAALGDAVRPQVDAVVALGMRLQSAAPVELKVETFDAAEAKAREPQLATVAMSGTEFFRGKIAPTLAPMFAGALTVNKGYAWKGGEVVSIRLAEATKGAGIYLRGAGLPTDNLVVTINGVHRVVVTSIVKAGGALLTLPPDLEVFDVRFEAQGSTQVRAIALVTGAK